MRMLLLTSCLVFSLAAPAQADWPDGITVLPVVKGKVVEVNSDLEKGAPMPDLSWASTSSMACFPGTQNKKFRGHHKLYVLTMPARSEVIITLTPKGRKNMSLYAYQIGTTFFDLPPKVQRATSCEADHKWDYPKKGKTQTKKRSVKLTSVNHPYNVVIGVSAPEGVEKGAFKLEVRTK
jgi:hypothetical protein